MKKLHISLMMGWVACIAQLNSQAQEFKEHVTKEFAATGNHQVLAVYNISGSVKVMGYSGTKVIMEIDKRISAKNAEQLEIGKKEFKLAFDQMGDTIEAYVAEPNDSRPHQNWNDNWHDRQIRYHYNADFVIKVPAGMNLAVSTVNDGDVTITDVTGTLDISNVNGSISISGAKGITDAHTVNGNITVTYLSVPTDESSYNTINGDLTVTYPSALSAELEFKSMNGNFYTDFDAVETLPFKVVTNDEKITEAPFTSLIRTATFDLVRAENYSGLKP